MAKRSKTPSFVVELPLVVKPEDERVLLTRFEAGRRLYNATLDDALGVLDRMRESKQWQAARAMPKGKEGSAKQIARTEAFRACIKRFDFSRAWIDRVAVAHKNAAGFADRLGADDTQRLHSAANGRPPAIHHAELRKTA